MTPTSIPSPQFVTKPWRCHGTLIRRLRAPPRLLVPSPPRVCRHFHLLSRHHLSFPSALADCHIHLTSTIFSITRSPAPCLFFLCPSALCPPQIIVTLPPHVAPSPLALVSWHRTSVSGNSSIVVITVTSLL